MKNEESEIKIKKLPRLCEKPVPDKINISGIDQEFIDKIYSALEKKYEKRVRKLSATEKVALKKEMFKPGRVEGLNCKVSVFRRLVLWFFGGLLKLVYRRKIKGVSPEKCFPVSKEVSELVDKAYEQSKTNN